MTEEDIRATAKRPVVTYIWLLLGIDALLFLVYLFYTVSAKTDAAGTAMTPGVAFLFGLFLVLSALPLFISKHPLVLWISGAMGSVPVLLALISLPDYIKGAVKPAVAKELKARDFFVKPAQIALADSILKGDTSQVRMLASKAKNLNARGKQDMNLLEFTIEAVNQKDNENAYREIMRILLEEGADPNQCLDKAVVYLSAKAFSLFLEKGGNPNGNGYHGEKVIFTAIRYGRLDNLRLLVEKGADTEVTDDRGWTPLLMMAEWRQWEGVRYLLEKGANFTHASPDGHTLLRIMAGYRDNMRKGRVKLPADYGKVVSWLAEQGVSLPPVKK